MVPSSRGSTRRCLELGGDPAGKPSCARCSPAWSSRDSLRRIQAPNLRVRPPSYKDEGEAFESSAGFLDFFARKRLQGLVLDLRVCFERAALSFEAIGERPAARCAPGRLLYWSIARGYPRLRCQATAWQTFLPGCVLDF
jgi:hypothetical protein